MIKHNLYMYLMLCIIPLTAISVQAQIGINTDNSNPDSSAILDIKSTNQGILIPRMTTAQRDSISSPVIGLTIFNLDDNCKDIYDGTTWMKDCPLVISSDSLIVDTWAQKAVFSGTARSDAVGFSINGKGYVGTGTSGGNKKDFWEYDPITNTWIQKADFPGTARFGAVGFSVNGKGYIGTGQDGSGRRKDFWEYDPITNTWIQKADFPGTARFGAVGFSVNGKGYIGTGIDSNFILTKDLWEYDPSIDQWAQKADLPGIARFNSVAFPINGKGYIGTGQIGSSGTKDLWEYDPSTNQWAPKADFPGPARWDAAGFSMDGKGYIGTGFSGSSSTKDFWEYDPINDSWTQKQDFLGGNRAFAVGFSINDKGYISTGRDGNLKNDLWEFSVSTEPTYHASSPYTGVIQTSTVDRDADTKIQVEETADEDVIRFDVAGSEAMVINNFGRVGIGTSSPSTNLDVNGDLRVSGNITASSLTGDGSSLTNVPGDQLGNHTAIQTLNLANNDLVNGDTVSANVFLGDGSQLVGTKDNLGSHIATTNLQLGSNWLSGDGGNEGVFVDAFGNVGIGNNNPQARLEVNGDIFLSSTILPMGLGSELNTTTPILNLSTNFLTNVVPDSIGAAFRIDSRSTNTSPLFQWWAKQRGASAPFPSDLLMILNEQGNLGIGRIASTNKLEVAGNASKNSAGDWLANSDARLKTNIQQLNPEKTLQHILALKGVKYEWADTKTGINRPEGTHYGFTAQNIQSVFPSLVQEDAQGYLQTAYGTYDAMYVEAIRALYQRIEQLESENAELQHLKLEVAEIKALLQHNTSGTNK